MDSNIEEQNTKALIICVTSYLSLNIIHVGILMTDQRIIVKDFSPHIGFFIPFSMKVNWQESGDVTNKVAIKCLSGHDMSGLITKIVQVVRSD